MPLDENKATDAQKMVALLIIVGFAHLGGFIVKVLSKGQKMPGCVIKPVLPKNLQIPPLVGMIFFGCFARNVFESSEPNIYYEPWADWVRQVCLSTILMMGGLELSFAGKGLTVVLLTVGP
jgi:Na+/glutamate symporter